MPESKYHHLRISEEGHFEVNVNAGKTRLIVEATTAVQVVMQMRG